jgi:hypothetical protein
MSMMVVLYLAAGRAFADLATIMYGFLDWNLRSRGMKARAQRRKMQAQWTWTVAYYRVQSVALPMNVQRYTICAETWDMANNCWQ